VAQLAGDDTNALARFRILQPQQRFRQFLAKAAMDLAESFHA